MLALSTYTALPLLALLGVSLCPSKSRAARALAGALGALLGTAAGTYLERAKVQAARSAVLRLLADHLPTDTKTEELRALIADARTRFGVPATTKAGEEFEDSALREVYESFLNSLLDGPEHDAGDLPALRRLRAALQLDGIVAGLAHKRAAQLLVSRGYSGLEGEAMRRAVDKLLFLSDRAFADEEPEEAGLYEMARIRKLLNISDKDTRQRIATVSRALYQQSLTTVVDEVDKLTKDTLAGASVAFGLPAEEAARMNQETYRRIAAELLSSGRLEEAGKRTLERAQQVLQLGDRETQRAFAAVAAPLLRKKVDQVAGKIRREALTPEALKEVADSLATRRVELGLSVEVSRAIVTEGFEATLRALYDAACRDLRANGDASALVGMDDMLAYASRADAVVRDLAAAEGGGGPPVAPLTLAAEPLNAKRLYGLYLQRSFAIEGGVPPERLSALLELSEEDEEAARVDVCQPRLRELYTSSIEKASKGGPPLSLAKLALSAEVAKFRLPRDAIEEAALEVYKARLTPLSGRVLKAPEKEDLDAARNFLGLSESDVRVLHLRAFGKTYEDSVREAMGRSGVMKPEVREALEQLRERLGLAPDDAEKIFHAAVEVRLKGMMEKVREAYEEATYTKEALTQIWKERGKDVGDDPSADGTGTLGIQETPPLEGVRGYKLMVELTNVADFYLGNKVLKEGKGVLPDEAYPVTVGKYLEEKAKEEIYGIYAWNAITCQDGAARDKWQRAKSHVGGILGLSPDMMQKVLQRMVSRWCNMFIKQKMQENGELGQEEISTLQDWVPAFFGIDKQVTKEMVQGANKGMLQNKVVRLLNKQKVTPADVQKLRDEVEAWDLTLQKDLELTRPQLRALFCVEVGAALEDESLSIEQKQDVVESSKESFGLGDEEARDELQELLKSRARGALTNAAGDLLQGKEARAVSEMRRLELLAQYAAGVNVRLQQQDWKVAPGMRQRLLQVYKTSTAAGKATDLDLLEDVLGVAVKAG